MRYPLIFFILAAVTFTLSAQTIFYDDFTDPANPKGWRINTSELDEKERIELLGNMYKVESIDHDDRVYTTVNQYINTSTDFEISAAIKYASNDNQGSGILFGFHDGNNHQAINITVNGYFKVGIKENGIWSEIKTWTKFDAINKGTDSYNIIKIIKQGKEIIYMINEQKAFSTLFIPFAGQNIGFVVHNRQTVGFDFMKVRQLDASENYLEPKESIAFDYFNDNSAKWVIENSQVVHTYIEDGKYWMDHHVDDQMWAANKTVEIDQTRDFEIRARFKKTDDEDNRGHGLIWGSKDHNNKNKFVVSGNKYYLIDRDINGKNEILVAWTESKAINKHVTGVSYNELSVVKRDNLLYWYVNGSEVHHANFEGFLGQEVGFIVLGDQVIGVDYLVLNYLE